MPDQPSAAERLYAVLVGDDEHVDDDLPDEVVEQVPGNAAKQVAARALQNAGDVVVDARTVLAWLLAAVAAPTALTALLVPIREAGSMLPQAALVRVVRRRRVRRWVWVAGAAGQAAAVAAMAVVAATASGAVAGVAILGALVLFAMARSLASLASKDVLGRTVPKGQRGRITGWSTTAAGVVAITLGVGLRLLGDDQQDAAGLATLLGVAALAWVAAGAVFATVREVPVDPDPDDRGARPLRLLRDDLPFRRFVVARTLLLVSALSPPFVVVLAAEVTGPSLSGLGPFVLGSGIAAIVGGRLWGGLADRSSRLVMVAACGTAAAVLLGFVLALRSDAARQAPLLYPAVYLLLALAHTGARIGRKTYVVDLAEGDARTAYVAGSNAAMGALLLATGALTSAVAVVGAEAALLLLAGFGVAGVVVGLRLPEVTDVRAPR